MQSELPCQRQRQRQRARSDEGGWEGEGRRGGRYGCSSRWGSEGQKKSDCKQKMRRSTGLQEHRGRRAPGPYGAADQGGRAGTPVHAGSRPTWRTFTRNVQCVCVASGSSRRFGSNNGRGRGSSSRSGRCCCEALQRKQEAAREDSQPQPSQLAMAWVRTRSSSPTRSVARLPWPAAAVAIRQSIAAPIQQRPMRAPKQQALTRRLCRACARLPGA